MSRKNVGCTEDGKENRPGSVTTCVRVVIANLKKQHKTCMNQTSVTGLKILDEVATDVTITAISSSLQ